MAKITLTVIPICVVIGSTIMVLNFVACTLFKLNVIISALVDTLGIGFLIMGYFLAIWYEMLIRDGK